MNFLRRLITAYRAIKTTGGDPQNPQYWVQKLFGRPQTASGIEVDEDIALKYSAVWAAVNIISGAIGFLPFNVYERIDKGKEKRPKHPVYRLLHDRPNDYMTAQVFREALQAHLLLWGNAYIKIERNKAGRPIALWPLMPNKVEPKVIELNGEKILVYELNQDGPKEQIFYDEIIHIPGLGWNGLKGYSVIQYCAENLGLGLSAEKHSANFFGHDSTPTGILHTDQPMSKETREIVEKQWKEKRSGLDKKFDIVITHSGLKYQPIGIPAKDAQLIEARKFGVNDISRWFQIPAHFLSDLEKATFSNIEHQGIEFVVWTLAKWLKKWEQECNYKLFSTAEQQRYFTEFNVDALLRGDIKTRYEAFAIGRTNGWLSANDIREKENMNPIEGGDTYLEPLNMKPVGSKQENDSRSFDILYEDTWSRIVKKEVNALKLKLDKPDFLKEVRAFYDNHKLYICKLFVPTLTARYGGIEAVKKAERIADEYVKSRIKELENSQNITELFDNWMAEMPIGLIKETINA